MTRRNLIFRFTISLLLFFLIGAVAYEAMTIQRYSKLLRADELTAQSVPLRDTNFDLSLLLSVEAFRLADTPRTRGVLLDNVQANPQLIRYLHEGDERADSVAFSPDGTTMAVGYFGGKVTLWDVASGAPIKHLAATWMPPTNLQKLPGAKTLGTVSALEFSPDGKVLVAGIYTMFAEWQIVALWDVATGEAIRQPLLEAKSPYALLFSPDGKTLAISEWGKISFWDMETSEFVGEIPVEPFEGLGGRNPWRVVSNPVFSHDGKIFAAITSVNTITFWDSSSLEPIGQPLVTGDLYSRNGVSCIAFGQDGRSLLTVTENGELTSWDLETRQSVQLWKPLHVDESNMMYGYGFHFSSDARWVMINSGDTVNVLDTQTGQPVTEPLRGNQHIGDMAISPDGKILATLSGRAAILWDLETSMFFGHFLTDRKGDRVAFSPDGELLAASAFLDNGVGSEVGLWNVATLQRVGWLGARENLYFPQALAFHPTGKILANGNHGEISIWDAETYELVTQFSLEENERLSGLAFNPDGTLLAVGCDSEVTLFDTDNWEASGQPLKPNGGTVQTLAFSPDGSKLAVADTSDAIVLWDVETRQKRTWTASSDYLDAIAFSPDGKTLATTDRNGKVVLWDVASQKAIGRPFILLSKGIPTALAFSPDGTMLVSGNYDNTINVWDVATRRPIGQGLVGNEWPVNQVVFSPDGTLLATASNKIILWDMSPQSWIETICQRVGRNFTREEWAQYIPNEIYHATCLQWPLEPEATSTPIVTP